MTLEIPNQLKEIENVQARLRDFLKDLPLDDYDRKKIFIAVDEILSNIISYGYEDNARHTIHIRFDATKTGMNMEFIDDGIYFDPIHFVHHHQPQYIDQGMVLPDIQISKDVFKGVENHFYVLNW